MTESVVILMRWRVCIGKHKAVGYGKIVNSQTCEWHPILQQKQVMANRSVVVVLETKQFEILPPFKRILVKKKTNK